MHEGRAGVEGECKELITGVASVLRESVLSFGIGGTNAGLGWVVGGLILLVVLLRMSMRSWRAGVRGQLRAWLGQHRREWRIEAETERQLVLQVPGLGPVTSPLLALYNAVAVNKTEPAEKQFEIFASALLEGAQSLGKPDPANLRPRLVPTAKLSSFPAGTPSTPIGETGLAAVYVIDSKHSVLYVDAALGALLGLDAAGLHQRSLDNLRASLPAQAVRGALAGNVQVFKLGDTYDAARLLLVPSLLGEGEEVAAGVPDRDTLLLAPVPKDWAALARANTPAGETLLLRPLRISSAGIAAV